MGVYSEITLQVPSVAKVGDLVTVKAFIQNKTSAARNFTATRGRYESNVIRFGAVHKYIQPNSVETWQDSFIAPAVPPGKTYITVSVESWAPNASNVWSVDDRTSTTIPLSVPAPTPTPIPTPTPTPVLSGWKLLSTVTVQAAHTANLLGWALLSTVNAKVDHIANLLGWSLLSTVNVQVEHSANLLGWVLLSTVNAQIGHSTTPTPPPPGEIPSWLIPAAVVGGIILASGGDKHQSTKDKK